MDLTQEQQATLAGSEGEALSLCLRSLVRYGEAFGARRLVPIKSAHLTGSFRIYFYSAYYELVGRLAREGVRFKVPTTLNPHPGYDFSLPNRIVFHGQREHEAQLAALGVIPNYSCVCYHHHNVPEFGDILGWAESSAVIWANSVKGARTNRNSIMMDICQAATGLTPEFGYLLDENRRGQLLVKLDIERMDAAALGYVIGKIAVDRVPVLTHYPFSQTELKNMGAAMASSGGVTLFHVVGLTPEAPTLEAVFDGAPAETVTVTQKDLDALSAPPEVQEESGMVVFGCPQMTLAEAEEIGRHFVGKRVNRRVLFHMMPKDYEAFSRTELCREVERAGVQVWQHCPLAALSLRIGVRGKQVLTPSGKLSYYLAGSKYGRLDEVLRIAGVAP